jgi:hypothetical protein
MCGGFHTASVDSGLALGTGQVAAMRQLRKLKDRPKTDSFGKAPVGDKDLAGAPCGSPVIATVP